MSSLQLLSVVALSRHGARSPLFKDRNSFAEGNSQLTLEGELQHIDNGRFLRERYGSLLNISSVYNYDEVYVRSSDTDRTIVSATSLLYGLYPPTTQTFALANGTVLTAPDNGYQQVPVHVVSQDQDVVLRGWFNCPKLDTAVNSFYVSDAYKAKEAAARNFLDSKISPLFNDKVFALSDMWNVFDYLNVQKSYNPNFPNLDEASWDTIRDLVSFLEYNKFHNGLGASSFAADLVWLLNSFKTPATSSSPLRKMSLYSGHYTTFVSFFGLSGLSTKNPELRGIPSYGSLLLFEFLKDPAMNEFYVRTVFRNGTRADVGGPAITSYAVGTPSNADATISKLDDFISTLKASGNLPVSSSLKSFCDVCGNNATRSCDLYAAQNALRGLQGGTVPGSPAAIRSLGDVYAGLIGAAVTLILCMIVATAFGLSAWNRWKKGYEQAVLAAVASSAGAEEDLIISEKKAAAALKSESS